MSYARQHPHELIDQVPEQQASALVRLLETIVDPLAAALRSAPVEDEEMAEQELRAGRPFARVVQVQRRHPVRRYGRGTWPHDGADTQLP